ncbi:phage holin family protein [bacterium]|nr:phage holin family protein [bacterium]
MDAIQNYEKQELLIVAFVLYFLEIWLKQAAFMKDKYIP